MIRKRVLWSWTDLPSTLSNSLADRYWIPISLLSWRCGLAGAIPPIAPPQQNRQFRYVTEMFPVYMGIAEVWDEYGYWASSFFCVRFGLFYTWKKKKKKKKWRGQYPISVSIAIVTRHVREGRIILFALVANQNTGFTTSFQLKELFI